MSKAKTAGWEDQISTPILLISGPEEFFATRALRNLKATLKTKSPDLEIVELEAGDYTAGSLLGLASPSLFNEPRLIVINGVERCSDPLITDGIAYLETPTDETTVVFRHSSGVRGKKLLEALRASSQVTEVPCVELKKDAERVDFAGKEFARAGRKVSRGALRVLCDAFAEDIGELAAACSQLIDDSAEDITETLVERYYAGRVETNSFKVVDAAVAGRPGEALALLRHLIGAGMEPVPLVAAFAMRMRLLAKLFDNRGASAAQLGAQPWQVDKASRELSGWSEEGLSRVIEEIAATDAAVKGAERDPVFALERLIVLITNRGVV